MSDGWESDGGAPSVSTNTQYELVSNITSENKRKVNNNYKKSRVFSNSNDGPRKQYRSDSYQNRSSGNNDSIEIPSRYVGKIIGRGGSKINELQNESGARIDIDKNHNGSNAVVRLSGSNDAIRMAKESIQKLISDDYGNDNGGRRNGSSSGRYNKSSSENNNYRNRNNGSWNNSNNRKDDNSGSNRSDNWGSSSNNNDNRHNDNNRTSGSSDNKTNDWNSMNNESLNNQEDDDVIDWTAASKIQAEYLKAKWAKLPPLKKDFYIEDEVVKNFSNSKVIEIRAKNNDVKVSRLVTKDDVEQLPIPNPIETFEQCFRNYPDILEEIRKNGFERPSPIQCQAWPVLLSGQDLIGIAQTGTGKTLAFLLPAFIHICGQTIPRDQRSNPSVLVYSPTRELALQIKREVDKYQYKDIKAVCLYGGGSKKEQIDIVTEGVDIIIATPGRLNDLVSGNIIDIQSITYLVLDEADRMLDLGFEPQIRKTLLDIRPDRQTVMTSATWPNSVRRLAESYMCNPVQVQIGSLDLAATHTVTQEIILVPNNDDPEEWKFNAAIDFIKNMDQDQKVIIFCMRKHKADHISSELAMQGISVQCMHGSLDQCDREQALDDITTGKVRALIATDLASRGLDIEDITHVINYDFPKNIEEYVHRVGRTGRAGRSGKAISYFTRSDWGHAAELISILEEANQFIPDELFSMAQRFKAMKERKNREGGGRFGGRRGGGGGRGRY